MNEIARVIFDALPVVRYVATYLDGHLELNQRPGITNTSASESDKYEELIVNPTLLKILEQRGNIDCGGLQYVVVRYGNFFEFVQPVANGHVSVGIQPEANLGSVVSAIQKVIGKWTGA